MVALVSAWWILANVMRSTKRSQLNQMFFTHYQSHMLLISGCNCAINFSRISFDMLFSKSGSGLVVQCLCSSLEVPQRFLRRAAYTSSLRRFFFFFPHRLENARRHQESRCQVWLAATLGSEDVSADGCRWRLWPLPLGGGCCGLGVWGQLLFLH